MYVIKNAWKNVIRSKGRNILIGLIVLVVSISVCISLSIRQAAENAQEDVEITGQITVDRQSMMQSMGEAGADRSQMKEKMADMEELSVEDLKKYAKSSSVKNFYYTLTTSLDGSNIEEVSTSDTTASDSSTQGPGGESRKGMNQGAFSLVGYSSEDAMIDFINGTCKITDGEMFEEGTTKKNCIISSELATYNSLEAGDTIKLVNPDDDSETLSLKVVGIYSNSSSTTGENGISTQFQPGEDPANQIYISYAALADAVEGMDSVRTQTNGTYVFADQDAYEQFQKDVEEMGLDDTYTVTSQDITSYEQSLIPLQNLSKFATYFFVVVLIIGAIVLVVINIFNIRERKYEIGVLTAIGMKKSKVCMQFVTELFIVTIFAMVIGLAAGSAASVPVSNQLLQSQIESQQEQLSNQEMNFGRGNMENGGGNRQNQNIAKGGFMAQTVDYISDISASVNLTVIIELFGVGILLTIPSSMTAVIFVMRYEPLKILSNRS